MLTNESERILIFSRSGGALGLVAAVVLTVMRAHTAMAVEPIACLDLDGIACISSSACTLVRGESGFPYQCVPIANECEAVALGRYENGVLDFSYDAKAACETREDCRFVPPGPCYCPPGLDCLCGGGSPPACVPGEI